MANADLVLTIAAVILFVLAAFPNATAPRPVRLEWLGVACLALTLIV